MRLVKLKESSPSKVHLVGEPLNDLMAPTEINITKHQLDELVRLGLSSKYDGGIYSDDPHLAAQFGITPGSVVKEYLLRDIDDVTTTADGKVDDSLKDKILSTVDSIKDDKFYIELDHEWDTKTAR